MRVHRYVASTSKGLEGVLEGELRRIGARDLRRVPGGVAFQGPPQVMIRGCLELWTAHRIRRQLGRFQSADADALYREACQLPWVRTIGPSRTFAVRATARGSDTLRNGRFVALKIKDAIVDTIRDAVGSRPSVDAEDPDVQVHVRVVGSDTVVSLDASGASLHARGYRTEQGEAPLRESLASGVLELARWRGRRPLLDPFCGSGTLLIEAALRATGATPGALSGGRFGFERWPDFDPRLLDRLREAAAGRAQELGSPVFGSDVNPRVLRTARANIERAGFRDRIRVARGDARTLAPPAHFAEAGANQPGLIVGNPPYGSRLGDPNELVGLYREVGRNLKARFRGWEAYLLLAEDAHRQALGLHELKRWRLMNGPLEIQLVAFTIP